MDAFQRDPCKILRAADVMKPHAFEMTCQGTEFGQSRCKARSPACDSALGLIHDQSGISQQRYVCQTQRSGNRKGMDQSKPFRIVVVPFAECVVMKNLAPRDHHRLHRAGVRPATAIEEDFHPVRLTRKASGLPSRFHSQCIGYARSRRRVSALAGARPAAVLSKMVQTSRPVRKISWICAAYRWIAASA